MCLQIARFTNLCGAISRSCRALAAALCVEEEGDGYGCDEVAAESAGAVNLSMRPMPNVPMSP